MTGSTTTTQSGKPRSAWKVIYHHVQWILAMPRDAAHSRTVTASSSTRVAKTSMERAIPVTASTWDIIPIFLVIRLTQASSYSTETFVVSWYYENEPWRSTGKADPSATHPRVVLSNQSSCFMFRRENRLRRHQRLHADEHRLQRHLYGEQNHRRKLAQGRVRAQTAQMVRRGVRQSGSQLQLERRHGLRHHGASLQENHFFRVSAIPLFPSPRREWPR